MKKAEISRALVGRIPMYLETLRALDADTETISATAIAKTLRLGEVQVRKDLSALCGRGKPKIGYSVRELQDSLEEFLGCKNGGTIIVGAGRLGRALLDYDGFEKYGITMLAAFDITATGTEKSANGKPILPMEKLAVFCRETDVRIGIIAVPSSSAQEVCNLLCANDIKAIWCFAPCLLHKPADVTVQYENMAISLVHLKCNSATNENRRNDL